MRELLEAGVHFGHQARRWNPKMKRFIFGERNGINIIDLNQTQERLSQACEFVKNKASEGRTVLFVGTKRQAHEAVEEAAKSCNMFFVTQRWLGGMLTNFETIRQRVDRLQQLREMEERGVFGVLPKKETSRLREQRAKLERILGGVEAMDKLPGVVFLVDVKGEETALREARRLDIPIVAIADTNCDPDTVDLPIPGNDDAIRALRLISGKIAEAVNEGLQARQAEMVDVEPEVVSEPQLVPDAVEGAEARETDQAPLEAADASLQPEHVDEAKLESPDPAVTSINVESTDVPPRISQEEDGGPVAVPEGQEEAE